MGSLIVCGHCHRHVKRQDRACPFCGTSLVTSPGSRAGLAAAFVVGLGMSFVGCGDEVETEGDGGGTSVGGMLTAYGPAPGGWGGYSSSGDGGDGGYAGAPAPAYGPAPGGFGGTGGAGGAGGNGGEGLK